VANYYNRNSISHRQSLPQNFIHVAATMDNSKDKNARLHYLVDDTVGFDDNLPVLVIVGSGIGGTWLRSGIWEWITPIYPLPIVSVPI
jgi:hypothetical protein